MKRLYILRHAKSSWDDPQLSDFERPLNRRGRKTAPFMGDLMIDRGYEPNHIVCSPAARAKETAKFIKEKFRSPLDIQFESGIYEASTNTLMLIVSQLNPNLESAMIVGHNPGFEGLVEALTGRYERMPTAALAIVELDIGVWGEIRMGSGKLIEILRPKEQKRLLKNS